jgi:hypothetical protein
VALNEALTAAESGHIGHHNTERAAINALMGADALLVASATAPASLRAVADYVCDGTSDQTEINAAITAAVAAGKPGAVQLTGGEYSLTGAIKMRQRSSLIGTPQTVLRAAGTWAAYDGQTQGGIIEPVANNTDRWYVYGNHMRLWGDRAGSGNTYGIYANTTTNVGFIEGTDSMFGIYDLYILETRQTAIYLRGAYSRENHIRDIRIFSCGNPGSTVAHGIHTEGNDSFYVDVSAGDCTGNAFWVNGTNNQFAICKGWFAREYGFLITQPRTVLSSCSAQDNLKSGFRFETGPNNASACTADSNSYDRSPSGAITGRSYYGFDIPWSAWVTLAGCTAYDKNEGARGIRQVYGFYLGSGSVQNQVIGIANSHFTGSVGGPGVDGAGNNIIVTGDQGVFTRFVGSAMGSEVTFWRSEATAATAAQGLDLPQALTELDASVQGSRKLVEPLDVGSQVQIAVTVRNLAATADSLTVSIRSTANTANVLATVTIAVPAAIGTITAKSVYTTKPAWFTADTTLGVYTSHTGAATLDYIFKDVTLRHRP